jgi:hypothetical protein
MQRNAALSGNKAVSRSDDENIEQAERRIANNLACKKNLNQLPISSDAQMRFLVVPRTQQLHFLVSSGWLPRLRAIN